VPKTGAVDPDDDFKMKYELIEIATRSTWTPSRSGEDSDTCCSRRPTARGTIAWHLSRS